MVPPLQGKGIWTLYDDIDLAVSKAPQIGAEYILCKISSRGLYNQSRAQEALFKVTQGPANLKPVAWTYMYLEDPNGEAELVRRALAAGFEAVLLDAEADINLKFGQAEQFSRRVEQLGLETDRIYLVSDPRLESKIDEIPTANLSRVCKGGFIPMIYGEIMPGDRARAAERVTDMAYDNYARYRQTLGYNKPLLPALASYWDNLGHARMTYDEFKKWCDEVEQRKASIVTLYRAGVTTAGAWQAFAELQTFEPDDDPIDVQPPAMPIVAPGTTGYSVGAYSPARPNEGWTEFWDKSGNLTRYRATSAEHTIWATYMPQIPSEGYYAVEVFIPGTHATTKSAQYFIVYHEEGTGERREERVVLNQLIYSDEWVTLAILHLDPDQHESGRVNLIDKTNDTGRREIAFSAIRWRPSTPTDRGYDPPIGTAEERAGQKVWPGSWRDANPYAGKYGLGYHTGADLNLNFPTWDLDRHAPVYAIGDGEVTYANERVGGAWQSLVVIRHDPEPDGTPVYSRYGHVDNIRVSEGDRVKRGQQIAQVGQSGGAGGNYHLHFDISMTSMLGNNPQHWPGWDLNSVKTHYVDPLDFIRKRRP